jgi:CBS domain-containing protein
MGCGKAICVAPSYLIVALGGAVYAMRASGRIVFVGPIDFPVPIRVANLWERCKLPVGAKSPWGAGNSGDIAMTIETILRQKGTYVATIEPEASIRRAADWLRIKNIGALVVTSGNAVRGLISEREIVHALSSYGETTASMPVKEIMRQSVITVSPEESVNRVMKLMTLHRVRHMPVLRDGKLVGIISIGDVVKYRLDDLELETNVLRDAYIAAR